MNTNSQSGSGVEKAPVRFLREPELLDRIGVTSITLRRWEEQGQFPRRRQLGANSVGWPENEVDHWCATRPLSQAGVSEIPGDEK